MRLGIIGFGRMGRRHLTAICAAGYETSVAIFDPGLTAVSDDRATVHGDLDSFYKRVDAVVIACPPRALTFMAADALRHGKHCLVEKPGALNQHEADLLDEAARSAEVHMAFGFTERFHAIARSLSTDMESLSGPLFIQFNRHGHIRDTASSFEDIVNDLIIHDIDAVIRSPTLMAAATHARAVFHTLHHRDFVVAAISAANDITIRFESSYGVFAPERKIIVSSQDSITAYDLYAGVKTTMERIRSQIDHSTGMHAEPLAATRAFSYQADILTAQLHHFISACNSPKMHRESVKLHRCLIDRITCALQS